MVLGNGFQCRYLPLVADEPVIPNALTERVDDQALVLTAGCSDK